MNILSMFKKLYLKFAPKSSLDPDDMNHWKEKILYTLIFISVFLVFIMGVINFPYLIKQNYWAIICCIIFIYLGCLVIFFFPTISYKKRAIATSFFCYLVGISIILMVGPFIAPREWLFSFSIIASVLLGWPGAIVSIAMNTITFIGIGILIKLGFWQGHFSPNDPLSLWFQTSTDLFFMNVVTTIFVTFLFQKIEESDRETKANSKLLLKEQVKLMAAKNRLEQEFKERKLVENKLRTIIEHSNELFFIQDTKRVLTYVSPTSEAVLGYTPEEIKRKWTALATDNPINLKTAGITELAIKTGKRQKPYLLESKKKNGTLVLLEIDESPVKDEEGKVVAISGAARDVTIKKLTDDRLIKSEQRFRDLFNAISDIIFTLDIKGCFISVNPAMCKALGHKEAELIGRPVSDFMKPEFVPSFKNEYLKLLKEQGHSEGTTIYFKKNGEEIYIEHRSVLVKPEDGKPFISGTGRDITERILSVKKLAKLQEQVAQSQKMESIGTLAGGIAHDFNNILFPILGYTEMLLQDTSENSQAHNNLRQIYAGAIRARELVKQILTFSRQNSREMKLMKIQNVIKEALKLIRSTIPTTIGIIQDINVDCGAIKADPTQIHQIVMNLATNAYHAMEKTGGELKVILREINFNGQDVFCSDMAPGVYACLTISDTGIGMDKNLAEKIFDPFFTTKEQGKGTGMGLSVAHGIVAGMKGTIQVYSEPDKGTTFKVYLPLVESFTEKQETKSQKSILKGSEQILLVDDEEEVLIMERQMLERMGYQVTSFTSSIKAFEIFCSDPNKFDMIITDMAMPQLSGDELAAKLIKICPDIPILLCTGFSETMSEKKAISIGIKGFLLKPIIMKDLSQKIRDVLDKNKR